MGFRFRCFGVGWCLLLLALTCLSQEYPGRPDSGEPERASSSRGWGIGSALRSIHGKVRESVNAIFQPLSRTEAEDEDRGSKPISKTEGVEVAGPESRGEDGPGVQTPTTKGDGRDIINAPLRCPPDHLIIDGRCRRKLRR